MALARQLRCVERGGRASVAALRCSGDTHLALPIHLAAGLAVVVDPLAPGLWRSITVLRRDEVTEELFAGLVGHAMPPHVPGTATSPGEATPEPITLGGKLASAGWHRIAAVDALDRWLQTPVNTSALQIERALVRAETAARLDDGPVRSELLADAVRLAHAAQPAFEEFLSRLGPALPVALLYRVRQLVRGVNELADLIPDAQDLRTISGVADRILRARGRSGGGRVLHGAWNAPGYIGDEDSHLLNPRLVPARVIRFSDRPELGEVRVGRMAVGDLPVLTVDVPAIGALDDADSGTTARDRLYARFVHTRTGRVYDRLLLTHGPAEDEGSGDEKRYAFSARLPLDDDIEPDELWVEVVDAETDAPPSSGSSCELLELRRQAVLLRQWRRLACLRRLGLLTDEQLVEPVRDVSGDRKASAAELDGGDPPASTRAKADQRRSMVTGPGDLLVAELAHAYETSVPD